MKRVLMLNTSTTYLNRDTTQNKLQNNLKSITYSNDWQCINETLSALCISNLRHLLHLHATILKAIIIECCNFFVSGCICISVYILGRLAWHMHTRICNCMFLIWLTSQESSRMYVYGLVVYYGLLVVPKCSSIIIMEVESDPLKRVTHLLGIKWCCDFISVTPSD